MNPAEISIVALVVSLCSFGFSVYVGIRDRGRLRATTMFFPASEFGPKKVRISIVNAGRRPIVLRMLVGLCDDNHWFGVYLDGNKSGLRLGEHEHHEVTWEKENLLGGPDVELIATDLQVEDSLGRRHSVRAARENLRKLLAP